MQTGVRPVVFLESTYLVEGTNMSNKRPLSPHEMNRYFSPEHRDGELSDEDIIALQRRLLEEWAKKEGRLLLRSPLSESEPGDCTMPKE